MSIKVSNTNKRVQELVNKYEVNNNRIYEIISEKEELKRNKDDIQWEIFNEIYKVNKGDIIRFKDDSNEYDAQLVGFSYGSNLRRGYDNEWLVDTAFKVQLVKKDKQIGKNVRYINLERTLVKVYGTHEDYLKEVK